MKKKTIIIIVIAALLIIGGIVAFKFYQDFNKKTPDAGEVKVDFTFSTDDFLSKYEEFEDDESARQYFDDKVIRLNGEVGEISKNQKTVDVKFFTNDPSIEINVNLVESEIEAIESYSPGDPITLQGFYTGRNSSGDIIEDITFEFNRAVIIKK